MKIRGVLSRFFPFIYSTYGDIYINKHIINILKSKQKIKNKRTIKKVCNFGGHASQLNADFLFIDYTAFIYLLNLKSSI